MSLPLDVETITPLTDGDDVGEAANVNDVATKLANLVTAMGAVFGTSQAKNAGLSRILKYFTNPLPGITWIDADTIEIAPCVMAMFSGNNLVIKENASALQIKLSANLDTGAEAASTWYDVFLIGDGADSQYTAKFVVQGNTPSGATYYKKIFAVRNDGSSNIIKFYHAGKKVLYDDIYNIDAMRVLNAGTSTSFADVDCSALVPAISSVVSFQASATSGTNVNWRANGSSATNGIIKGIDAATQYFTIEDVPLDASRIGEYKVNGSAQVSLWVKGYEMNLL